MARTWADKLDRIGAGVSAMSSNERHRRGGLARIGEIQERDDELLAQEEEKKLKAGDTAQKIKLKILDASVKAYQSIPENDPRREAIANDIMILGNDLQVDVSPFVNLPGAQQESKYQSGPGKLLADRRALVNQYGEGSAELAAFDKAADETKAPQTTEFERLSQIPEEKLTSWQRRRLEKLTTSGPLVQNTIYPEGAIPNTQTTMNELQSTVMNAESGITQMEQSLENFDSEFLTVPGKAKAAGLAMADKLGMRPNAQRTAYLADFEKFRSGALNTINEYIKVITGAAMSNAEADRLRKAMPDPGEDILSGDGPTQFKSKLERVMRDLKLKRSKALYQMRNGFRPIDEKGNETMTDSQFRMAIDERGTQLEKEFIANGMPKAEAENAARIQVRREFMGE